MRRASACLFVFLFITFSLGCANRSLDALKDLQRKNEEGLISVYNEALERQYTERKSVEAQFIDLQSEHTFLINAYIRETNLRPDEVMERQVFSIAEIKTHNEAFHKRKVERWRQIDASYQELMSTIEEKRSINLSEEIERIEGERKETGNIFSSGLKKIGGIFSSIF